MPMFQVDGGRPVVVHPVRPSHDLGDASRVVTEHVGALLGEQLLPVRVREGEVDEPYLLAVDVAGRPVVVEVVSLLDGDAVLRALRHLGRVGRLSLRDVAGLYRGGRGAFAADLAAFRESVPSAALPGASPTPGPRLLLVCSDVAPELAEVVDALLSRGVDVLQVGVLDGPDGRLLDVSPIRLSGARVEPVGAATGPVARSSLVTRVPTGLRFAVDGVPAQGPTTESPVRVPVDGPVAGVGLGAGSDDAADVGLETRPVPVQAGVRPGGRTVGDGRLVELVAATGGEPVVLVWHRHRRGTFHEALLHADGLIELTDGTRVTDPSAAAEIAAASQAPVDGWRVWRVGTADGPTLAEAVRG
jgi:hypothetical protein